MFFIFVIMKIFGICPYKIFNTFFILTKLKCVFLAQSKVWTFEPMCMTFLRWLYAQSIEKKSHFTSVVCITDVKYITFTLIICITDIKSHRRFRFIRTYIRVKKWYISFYDKEKYTEILKEWILNIFIFAYLRGRNTFFSYKLSLTYFVVFMYLEYIDLQTIQYVGLGINIQRMTYLFQLVSFLFSWSCQEQPPQIIHAAEFIINFAYC